MSDAKCPMCRGEMVREFDDGSMWWCRVCGNEPFRPDATGEGFKTHAYWEPRPRLPTVEEEAAHMARHGAGAGWALLVLDVSGRWVPGDLSLTTMQRAQEIVVAHGEDVKCYPHVNGRPVGWP